MLHEIPDTKERKRLDEIIDNRANYTSVMQFFEDLRELGINLVEFRNPLDNDDYNCRHFVFYNVMEEDWIEIGKKIPAGLTWDTLNFLSKKGYVSVYEPQDMDVVAYMGVEKVVEKNIPKSLHFGVYNDGLVFAKWGNGHVMSHEIDMIPGNLGDTALFFRKS